MSKFKYSYIIKSIYNVFKFTDLLENNLYSLHTVKMCYNSILTLTVIVCIPCCTCNSFFVAFSRIFLLFFRVIQPFNKDVSPSKSEASVCRLAAMWLGLTIAVLISCQSRSFTQISGDIGQCENDCWR